MADTSAVPSRILQCEMLIRKVEDWSKERGNNVLKACLVEVLLETLEEVFANYGSVFGPLKKLVNECVFYDCSHLSPELESNHIPYFSVAEYFSQKVCFVVN